MSSLIVLISFIGLPLAMAAFLLWRAYQLGVKRRVELTRQWAPSRAPSLHRFAVLFAWRDLMMAIACVLVVGLLLAAPKYYAAWTSLLAAFGWVHTAITQLATRRAQKAAGAAARPPA